MKEIWLYGAGDMGMKIMKILSDFHFEISGFIESSEEKCKVKINDKEVISVKEYNETLKNKVYVIITPIYPNVQEVIRTNLLSNGTKIDNIVTKEYLIRRYWKIPKDILNNEKIDNNRKWILDTGDSGSFGGVEKYTFNLARLLRGDGEEVEYIFPADLKLVPEDLAELAINYNFFEPAGSEEHTSISCSNMIEYMDINFEKRLLEVIHILCKKRPFNLVLRNPNMWYVAAAILKDYYPKDIKILNVIHGNESCTRYDINCVRDDLEVVICSNSGIKEQFIQEGMKYIENKLVVKSHPIIQIKNEFKNVEHDIVRLGYAGRLETIDKRVDLIPLFLDELSKYNLEFEFFIAGEGAYENELKKQIFQREYADKVFFLGKLPYDQIFDFWNSVDVFLNFSDTEGFCLSMIEALQCGKVCVSTKVHEDIGIFIKDGVNGYVVPIGNMKMMAEKVLLLLSDFNQIKRFGEESRSIIQSMDDGREYLHFLKEI